MLICGCTGTSLILVPAQLVHLILIGKGWLYMGTVFFLIGQSNVVAISCVALFFQSLNLHTIGPFMQPSLPEAPSVPLHYNDCSVS